MATEEEKPPLIGQKGLNFDILVVQGTTWGPYEMVLLDDVTGEPVDLTGTKHVSEIRKTPDSPEAAAVAVIEVIDGPAGVVSITYPAGETVDVPADPTGEKEPDSMYVWDWLTQFPDGHVEQIAWGNAPVFRRVSKGAFV